ncbi:MAG TPA: Rne/Rng family ribonuclease [Rhodothermales bacterium]|nr:Rne/Rng family ribonuclease [Rhodothermales bacterium]
MAKQIVVNAQKSTTRIALLEDGQLAEFHLESPDHARTIGNIYLGRVKKVMPNIRAAFVDVGQKQDAFLHFSDLTDNLPLQLAFLEDEKPVVGRIRIRTEVRLARLKRKHTKRRRGTKRGAPSREATRRWLAHRHELRRRAPEALAAPVRQIPRKNRLEDYLQQGQRILVKIIKEPISAKGPRASTDISLAGRFLVLVPLADYIAVSKKISSFREKRRLRALARSLVPDGFGVIVRTQAEGKSARTLDTDLRLLVEKWRAIEAGLAATPRPPVLLHEDLNMVSSVVRDLFSEDYERILVDEPRLYRALKAYVAAVAPQMEDAVQLHKGPRPVFEAVGIEQDLRATFETRVPLPSGGYLFIERTEAMHVVDVNSGRAGRGLSQEENALRVNMEAARVVCRQIRLRDLGGIIVIDFIDLRDDKNRRKVLDEIKKEFRKDRAVTKVLPMSDFGVVQITRQRLRPSYTHTGRDAALGPEAPGATGGGQPLVDDPLPEVEPEPAGPSMTAPSEPVAVSPVMENGEAERDGSRRRGRRGGEGRESDGGERRRRDDPAAFVERVAAWFEAHRGEARGRGFVLRVHPFAAAFLGRVFPAYHIRWSLRFRTRIRVEEDPNLGPFSFRVHDAASGEELTGPPGTERASMPAERPAAERVPGGGRTPQPVA